MFCSKCGKQLTDDAQFCSECGSSINSQLTSQKQDINSTPQIQKAMGDISYRKNESPTPIKKSKKKIKRWHIVLIVLSISIILFSNLISKLDISGNFFEKIISNKSSEHMESSSEIQVNFDLNEYDSYGNFSDGLIWVEKTISSYDSSPETKFAYLDIDGNVVSEWFYSSNWHKADFSNGLLVLRGKYDIPYSGAYIGSPPSEVVSYVYDKNFNLIASLYVTTNSLLSMNKSDYELVITDADENGNVFAVGKQNDDSKSLYRISADGVIRFDVAKNKLAFASVSNLKRIHIDNGYYVVDFRDSIANLPSGILVFDNKGNLIMDVEDKINYTVFSLDIVSEDKIKIMFEGKDDNYYDTIINFKGEFLSTPTLSN